MLDIFTSTSYLLILWVSFLKGSCSPVEIKMWVHFNVWFLKRCHESFHPRIHLKRKLSWTWLAFLIVETFTSVLIVSGIQVQLTTKPKPSKRRHLQARIQDCGQGGQRSFDLRGTLNPKFAQNRCFPSKLPENALKKYWGKEAWVPRALLDPLMSLVLLRGSACRNISWLAVDKDQDKYICGGDFKLRARPVPNGAQTTG